MRDSEHVSVLLQDSCRSECTRCKGVLTQWLSAAAVADCSRHVWTNQGQICEAHRGRHEVCHNWRSSRRPSDMAGAQRC